MARRRLTAAPPVFVAPQLCRYVSDPPEGKGWLHEVKFDGYRIQMRVKGRRAVLRTRKGLDWTARFPAIAAAGGSLGDCLLDGEIVALDRRRISDFGLLQNAISKGKAGPLVYYVFDCLFASGRDLRKEPLKTRMAELRRVLRSSKSRSRRIRLAPHFALTGAKALKLACRRGLEGVISKRADSVYRSGRGDTWTKSKCRGGQEVVIGGWSGTRTALRSLLVGAHAKGKLVYMGRVGTGYSVPVARDLLARLVPLERDKSAFADPPRAKDVHWVRPRLVAEIEFENVTRDGLFRQAAFKGLRSDKPAGAVMRETPRRGRRAKR